MFVELQQLTLSRFIGRIQLHQLCEQFGSFIVLIEVDLCQAWRENGGSRELEWERERDSAWQLGGGGGGGGGGVEGERRRRKGGGGGSYSYYLHASLV